MCDKHHNAIHEAGHAVMMHALGYEATDISMVSNFSSKISAQIGLPNINILEHRNQIICGGVVATYIRRTGIKSSDGILDTELDNIWSEFGGNGGENADFWKIDYYTTQLMKRALDILLDKCNWGKVIALHEELIKREILDKEEICNIFNGVDSRLTPPTTYCRC